ncbi:Dabb family protein [Hominifimenecus sp. rT4P-3]|uniref:Dabb family protein n=1 Tax=Hominifimenecus sp. rT4P-3 TaxID=3242979 RepID=UPI003DA30E99
MIRHIVSWNFKPEISEEKRVEIRAALAEAFPTLVGKIPGLIAVSVGMPPLESSNCDLALYCEMEEEKDLIIYRDHPEHVKIAEIVRANCEGRRCVDIKA